MDVNLSFGTNGTMDEKYCKYSYSSWCPTCERNSPRRRSKSETNEPCRRKCKEMKTFTPKKYLKSQEYENMELEYDMNSRLSEPFNCCSRIRSNLCELPTTYISNNCQSTTFLSKFTSNTSDFVDCCLKSVKTYEHTLKYVDLANFSMKMHDKQPQKCNKTKILVTSQPPDLFKSVDNHCFGDYRNGNNLLRSNDGYKRNYCRDSCQLPNCSALCYDTGTYFNRTNDTINIQERYSEDVAYLREKLRLIQKTSVKDEAQQTDNVNKKELDVVKTKPKNIRRERAIFSPPLLKCGTGRFGAHSKTFIATGKLKKVKNKTSRKPTTSSPEVTLSECSDSESEEDVDDNELDNLIDPPSTGSEESGQEVCESNFGSGDDSGWPLRHSLFPNIPPYLRFISHENEIAVKLPAGKKFFKWKLSTITPIIVRKTLTNSGFVLVRKSNQWLGTWGKHMKSPVFKTLKDFQKLNHFPGTFQLGRKDKLWRNFQRLINQFGQKEFGFLPHTYILPLELKLLKQNWEYKNGKGGEKWIIKPPASARGVGIKVINKWSQLPKKTSLIVQKYISNPYLINGSKFDLRLYVLVTSFHPLRIYLYPDGLARFASAKYSDDAKDLKDRYMHLTNYSINKLSSQYTANEDANACQGHKWTISKLWEYLQKKGVDTKSLWKTLQQLVIKTIISAEAPITQLCEENMNSLYNCYELFGVDVLLDENLKPWLLEVNISPSLHSASPLDAHVKGPLVQTLFDLAQFHLSPRLQQSVRNAPQCFDPRLYTTTLTKKERSKHALYVQYECRDDYLSDILNELTGDDVRHLTRAEDEFVAMGNFERLFPTQYTHKYFQYMEPRYYNRLFDAWEMRYANRRQDGIALLQSLCTEKVHLKVASQTALNKSLPNTIHGDVNLQPSTKGQSRPLEEIMEQTSITNKVATTNS